MGYENKTLGCSDNTYTLWYNLFFINLFYVVIEKLKKLRVEDYYTHTEPLTELVDDLNNLRIALLSSLDPLIKHQIKSGVLQ
jgi:hypothetical protein